MNLASSVYKLLPIVTMLAGLLHAAGEGNSVSAPGRATIDIDGVQFSLSDLQRNNPGGLFQARNALYEAERKAADEFINEYLLDREARKEDLTVETLLELRVYSALKDPPEEALHVYYEGVDTKESYEAVRGKIVEAIREKRKAKAKAAFVQSLRSKAAVSVRLAPPRAELSTNGAFSRGASAPVVTLVEYADYECPYCQQIQPTVAKLEAEYKDKIAFTYKDVPLPMHANAQKASEAAHCAGVQGKYWQYHDLLFERKQYDITRLKEYARSLQLDGQAFDRCLDSGAQADVIKKFVSEAQALGLPGTPGFFVNGRFISGAVDYQMLREIVEQEIDAAASRVADAGRAGNRQAKNE